MFFLQCTKTCKGGVITRTLACKKPQGDGKFSPVPDDFCKNAVKPPVTEPCNTDVSCKRKNYYFKFLYLIIFLFERPNTQDIMWLPVIS